MDIDLGELSVRASHARAFHSRAKTSSEWAVVEDITKSWPPYSRNLLIEEAARLLYDQSLAPYKSTPVRDILQAAWSLHAALLKQPETARRLKAGKLVERLEKLTEAAQKEAEEIDQRLIAPELSRKHRQGNVPQVAYRKRLSEFIGSMRRHGFFLNNDLRERVKLPMSLTEQTKLVVSLAEIAFGGRYEPASLEAEEKRWRRGRTAK